MSYNLDVNVLDSSAKEDNGDETVSVALDGRHTAVLSRCAGLTSIAILDGKYNSYCTKEVFPMYNKDIITVSDDEAKRLVKDMLMIFKR